MCQSSVLISWAVLCKLTHLALQGIVRYRRTAAFYYVAWSRIGLNALLGVYVSIAVTVGCCLALPFLSFASFVRKSTAFPTAAERGG